MTPARVQLRAIIVATLARRPDGAPGLVAPNLDVQFVRRLESSLLLNELLMNNF